MIRWGTLRGVAAGGLLMLGLTGYGTPTPLSATQDVVTLGSTGVQLTTVPRFVHGIVWWQIHGWPWHHTAWNMPTTTMPTPLKVSLTWADDLVAGQWPGAPPAPSWAVWAGHVGPPLGWVVWPESSNGGPAHPLSVLVILPEKAPYRGYGTFFLTWTYHADYWRAQVANPQTIAPSSHLRRLWTDSTVPRRQRLHTKG